MALFELYERTLPSPLERSDFKHEWALHYPSVFRKKISLGRLTLVPGGEWYRLITHRFVHADLLHSMFNIDSMWSLRQMGQRMGFWQTFVIGEMSNLGGVVGGGLGASRMNTDHVGISAMPYGFLGFHFAELLWRDGTKAITTIIRLFLSGELSQLLLSVVLSALNDFLYPDRKGFRTGIAHGAHYGGLMSGFLLGTAMCPWTQPNYKRRHAAIDTVLSVGAASLLSLYLHQGFSLMEREWKLGRPAFSENSTIVQGSLQSLAQVTLLAVQGAAQCMESITEVITDVVHRITDATHLHSSQRSGI